MGKGFSKQEGRAWGGLLTVYNRMDDLIEADLQGNFGISHVEFEILLRLSWTPEHRLRLQDLAANSLLTRSGISRAVERLERLGLVQRSPAPEDRRGAYAVLTEKGAALFDEAMQKHVSLVKQYFLSVLTPEELEQLAAIWKKIGEHQNKTQS